MLLVVFIYLVFICIGIRIRPWGQYTDNNIDITQSKCLKGICTIEIMLGHLGLFINSPFLYPFRKAGILVVGVFFFLSGYGLEIKAKKNVQKLSYYVLRKTIWLLFWLFMSNLVYVLYEIIILKEHYSWIQTVKTVLGIGLINYPTWYLYELILFYIIFIVLNRWTPQHMLVALILLSMAGIHFAYFLNLEDPWYGSSMCFAIGIGCSFFEKKFIRIFADKWKYFLILIISVVFLASGLIGFYIFGEETYIGNLVCRNLASMAFVVIIYFLLFRLQLEGKIYEWLSNISLYIYLLHMLIMQALLQIDIFMNNQFLFAFSTIIITIFVAEMVTLVLKFWRKVLNHGKR